MKNDEKNNAVEKGEKSKERKGKYMKKTLKKNEQIDRKFFAMNIQCLDN